MSTRGLCPETGGVGVDLAAWIADQGLTGEMTMTITVRDFGTDELIQALRERGTHVVRARAEVRAFAESMERRLANNDHKSGWKQEDPKDLFQRLREKEYELYVAMYRMGSEPSVTASEAVDVANFAMMIADVCGGL